MTDDELIDAIDDAIVALARVRWAFFPEDTGDLIGYVAEEACARLVIDMMMGRLDGLTVPDRQTIANADLIRWTTLHHAAPTDAIYERGARRRVARTRRR